MKIFTQEFIDFIKLKRVMPAYRHWKLDRFWKKNQKEIELKIRHQWHVYQHLKYFCEYPQYATEDEIIHLILHRELNLYSIEMLTKGMKAIGIKIVP
jgi:hypothetical protein